MKQLFTITKRYSWMTAITVEIECETTATNGVKLGLAVRVAYASGSVLRGAVLRDADLRDADLSGADLRDADLRGADLRDADLRDAVLRGAVLSRANLSGADLSGSVLIGADLRGAVLSDADLRFYKADFWHILTLARREVPMLIDALKAGNVDGSTYEGECACLIGTLDNAGAIGVPRDANSPTEQWFTMIGKGDIPGMTGDDGKETDGGFAARIALEWAFEYCSLTGIEVAR